MKYILLLALTATGLMADATGKWTGTLTPDGGEGEGPALLVLKQDGTTLTGTAGPADSEQHEVLHGKIEDGKITFEVIFGEATLKFSLTQEGEEIKGGVTLERGGETKTAKLAVKRQS
jgi:hypothetical protein